MSVQQVITEKLSAAFQISHLSVENESHRHNVPAGSESHFKVVLVTDDFESLRQVARHQAVYKVLADELKQGVHALALHTYSQQEWAATREAPASPNCMGGGKH
ncbi:MAG: BolA/IbaG family iron-sulfur metabolism protein [Oceanospirillaceae bacterium]|nr:BolA/IbaG family iron-sulfur metabolism protein [Oceanospirillaceae bacterium]MCP5335308.1 BolA/IbaG family iron-sulfur metabolism protein [Oceanospirillaceae bacterium]MCP5350739.1 BolA/IbaG family iron-sulfur metabolism protein [Oceanospirillaceae bacterium]